MCALTTPQYALSTVITTFAAGHLQYEHMVGKKLRYGKGLVLSYSLARVLEE
jgi:hypothetical protein